MSNWKDWLKRPELLTFLAAGIITALNVLGVPAKLAEVGLPLPVEQINQVVGIFWAVFLGAVLEGKYKGVDYLGGLKQLFGSLKMRVALGGLLAVILNGLLKAWFDLELPADTLGTVLDMILVLIGVKGTADVLNLPAIRLNLRE